MRTFARIFLLVSFAASGSCCSENASTAGGVAPVEFIFNDPLSLQTPQDRCNVPVCTALLGLINHATKTVDFAVYGMRNQNDLLKAIEAAKKRGVRVRGFVDRDRAGNNYYESTNEWVERLGDIRDDKEVEDHLDVLRQRSSKKDPPCPRPAGFKGPLQCLAYDLGDEWLVARHASRDNFVSDDAGEGPNQIMHNKFFVVDGESVWTGSTNISDSCSGGYNANVAVVIHSVDVANVYTAEFAQLWEGRSHRLKRADGVERFQLADPLSQQGIELTTWFSPQDKAMRYGVETLVARAQERIDIAVFYLTNKFVTADLIAAHRRGVKVRVIVDATSAANGYTKHELLREAGILVKVENWGGKMHMKMAAFDDTYVVVGSMNWTRAGDDANDENTLILRSSRLANQYETFFDHLWQSIPDQWGEKGARPDPESMASGSSCRDGIDNDFDKARDSEDSGCTAHPQQLPLLPPHRLISKAESPQEPREGYRLLPGSRCDAAYPDWYVCVPPRNVRRIRCSDLPYREFRVLPADPQHLDPDHDGTACEPSIATASHATEIPASKAADHIGEDATVRGTVVQVSSSAKGTVFLNFGASHPHEVFTAVVFADRAGAFSDLKSLAGRDVSIRGRIASYKGKPQVVLQSRSQIVQLQ